jgi:hypothetical protein
MVNQTNPPATNAVVWQPDATGLYQPTGAGNYYLAADSPYRNAGATNLSTNVLALLRTRTTYPPLVISNAPSTYPPTFLASAALRVCARTNPDC